MQCCSIIRHSHCGSTYESLFYHARDRQRRHIFVTTIIFILSNDKRTQNQCIQFKIHNSSIKPNDEEKKENNCNNVHMRR